MKKELLFTLFLVLNNLFLINAQSLEWNKLEGWGGYDYPGGISRDSLGNIYVTGYYEEQYHSIKNRGIFISKYDATGNRLWSDTSTASFRAKSQAISTDGAGNSYITGEFKDTIKIGDFLLSSSQSQYNSAFVAKYNSNGICLWAFTINHASGEGIVVDNNGSFYVTGAFADSTNVCNTTLTVGRGYLIKYDSLGICLWAKQFGNPDFTFGKEIGIDDNNNIYISGRFWETAQFDNTTITAAGFEDGFIVKYDSSGNLQWVTRHSIMSDMSVDDNGNIYLTRYDFMEKLNSAGQQIWSKVPDNSAGGKAIFADIYGNIYASGNGNNGNLILGKYDANGFLQWTSQIPPYVYGTNGSSYAYVPSAIITDGFGNVYSTGQLAAYAIFIAKISDNNFTTNIPQLNIEDRLLIFPNPTANTFNVVYASKEKGRLQINIRNITGQVIYSESVSQYQEEYRKAIDLSKQAKGVYFIEVAGDKNKQVKRIVIN